MYATDAVVYMALLTEFIEIPCIMVYAKKSIFCQDVCTLVRTEPDKTEPAPVLARSETVAMTTVYS